MKRCTSRFLVVALVTLWVPASAQASILGEENAQLAAIVGNQLKEIAELKRMVDWLRTSAARVNETLALARKAASLYQQIRDYSPAQLLADAKRGLYDAMPELESLEEEIRQNIGNGVAIAQGHGAFFRHRDKHDRLADTMGDRLFSLGYRGLARKLVHDENAAEPSKADRLLTEHYAKAGEAYNVVARRSALRLLEAKVDAYVEDTDAKNRVDLRMAASGLEMNLETAANTGDLAQATRLELAKEEASSRDEATFNQQLGNNLADEAKSLFRPDWMR